MVMHRSVHPHREGEGVGIQGELDSKNPPHRSWIDQLDIVVGNCIWKLFIKVYSNLMGQGILDTNL